jgi:hypothetical protein
MVRFRLSDSFGFARAPCVHGTLLYEIRQHVPGHWPAVLSLRKHWVPYLRWQCYARPPTRAK